MDPSTHDKALLQRLNALKPSSITLSSTSPPFPPHGPPNEQGPDDHQHALPGSQKPGKEQG
ncbi:hypothetical protein XPA_001168 [Xanthoria parietina]